MEWKIVLNKEAISALKNIPSSIGKSSEKGARKVSEIVLDSTGELKEHPFKHPPDKYYKMNTGSVRAYEILRIRIIYSVSEAQITALSIRPSKRNPKIYQL